MFFTTKRCSCEVKQTHIRKQQSHKNQKSERNIFFIKIVSANKKMQTQIEPLIFVSANRQPPQKKQKSIRFTRINRRNGQILHSQNTADKSNIKLVSL